MTPGSSFLTKVLSFLRLEPESTASLRRRLRDADKDAASGCEAIAGLHASVVSLERGLRAAVLERNAAVARMHEAEARAEEAEDAAEAAARAGELAAAGVREKERAAAARDARIRELTAEMLSYDE